MNNDSFQGQETHVIVRGKERNGDEMHQDDEILQGTNI